MKKTLLAIIMTASSCFFTYAQITQTSVTPSSALIAGSGAFTRLIALAQTFLNKLVPFIIGLAVLGFFWYLILFIWKGADNPEERKKARLGVFFSLVALFVIVGIWGIIAVAANMLGVGTGGAMPAFKLPGEI
jgi:hypothetical protein